MNPLVEEIVPAPDPAASCEALAGLPYRLFLDSASAGSRFGRYSFLTADPVAVVRSRGDEMECLDLTTGSQRSSHGDALVALRQLLAPGRRELVETPSPLAGTLDPPAGNAALRFEAIEDRIQRRDIEHDRAVGSLLDARGDVIAMPRLLLELREDEEFRGTFLEGVFVRGCVHMS